MCNTSNALYALVLSHVAAEIPPM